MKCLSILTLAALSIFSAAAHAEAFPVTTEYYCQDQNQTLSSIDVTVSHGGPGDQIWVSLMNHVDNGPSQFLGNIVVSIKPVPAGIAGAGLTFLGKNFELGLCTDCAPQAKGISSHLDAEIKGHVVHEDLYCRAVQNEATAN